MLFIVLITCSCIHLLFNIILFFEKKQLAVMFSAPYVIGLLTAMQVARWVTIGLTSGLPTVRIN